MDDMDKPEDEKKKNPDETVMVLPYATSGEPPITIGRIVHFAAHENDEVVPRAAVVVHVWSATCCNLAVFDGKGQTFTAYSVTKGSPAQPGTWSYPPRA